MKIGIIGDGFTHALIDHMYDGSVGIDDTTEAVLVQDPLCQVETELPLANTCSAVMVLMGEKQVRAEFFAACSFSKEPTVSYLYSLFNGKDFGDFLEVSFTGRFMTHDVGPDVGFSTGAGIPVDASAYEAIQGLTRVRESLGKIGYRGEVLLPIAANYTINNIFFGHCHAHFALYAELCKQKGQDIWEFVFGKVPKCELYQDTVVIGNLISRQPFPVAISGQGFFISAPKSAEKHLWRYKLISSEAVLVVVRGINIYEARSRCRKTIQNMLQYDKFLQFRTDYAYGREFVLSREAYEKFKTKKWEGRG